MARYLRWEVTGLKGSQSVFGRRFHRIYSQGVICQPRNRSKTSLAPSMHRREPQVALADCNPRCMWKGCEDVELGKAAKKVDKRRWNHWAKSGLAAFRAETGTRQGRECRVNLDRVE